MITIECTGTRPGINWFTPGKKYSGYADAGGQAIHTKDDFGRDTFVFFAASLHGSFREVTNGVVRHPAEKRVVETAMSEAFRNCGLER
ncbi:TPA: hypothetical protein LVL74_004696 [Klebsiella oxytoca]|nr:hypothetical protein [Klebsiella oxytoca]HBM3171228.1 hypothetical protein [Klebsiella oxytoca]